jgi:hypothetical protein
MVRTPGHRSFRDLSPDASPPKASTASLRQAFTAAVPYAPFHADFTPRSRSLLPAPSSLDRVEQEGSGRRGHRNRETKSSVPTLSTRASEGGERYHDTRE